MFAAPPLATILGIGPIIIVQVFFAHAVALVIVEVLRVVATHIPQLLGWRNGSRVHVPKGRSEEGKRCRQPHQDPAKPITTVCNIVGK
jgi:hypothetical protein